SSGPSMTARRQVMSTPCNKNLDPSVPRHGTTVKKDCGRRKSPLAVSRVARNCKRRLMVSRDVGPLRLDVDGVERLAGRHEQAVALGAAEADVAADLRQQHLADA